MFPPVDRLVGFAVVFEGPHGIPEIGAIGGDHDAIARGGEDLVLADAPGGHITEAASLNNSLAAFTRPPTSNAKATTPAT